MSVFVPRVCQRTAQDEEMRLREVAEAERDQMMKARQQKLLEGQQVNTCGAFLLSIDAYISDLTPPPPHLHGSCMTFHIIIYVLLELDTLHPGNRVIPERVVSVVCVRACVRACVRVRDDKAEMQGSQSHLHHIIVRSWATSVFSPTNRLRGPLQKYRILNPSSSYQTCGVSSEVLETQTKKKSCGVKSSLTGGSMR